MVQLIVFEFSKGPVPIIIRKIEMLFDFLFQIKKLYQIEMRVKLIDGLVSQRYNW